jgi:hypothetical protein
LRQGATLLVSEDKIIAVPVRNATMDFLNNPKDLGSIRAVHQTATGLGLSLYAAPARNPSPLKKNALPGEVEPTEAERDNLRGPPADLKPNGVKLAKKSWDVREKTSDLFRRQRIGRQPLSTAQSQPSI